MKSMSILLSWFFMIFMGCSSNSDAWYFRGSAYYALTSFQRAYVDFARLVKLEPESINGKSC
jgi:hypothetical protein